MSTVAAPAKRGEIFDRNGRLLAYSVDADTIYAVPTEIADAAKTAAALCDALDDCTRKMRDELRDRLAQQRSFVYVRRRATPMQAKRVAALGLEGIGVPQGEQALLSESRAGRASARLRRRRQRRPRRARSDLRQDRARPRGQAAGADRRAAATCSAGSSDRRPPARSIELTIDEHLQHIAEREVRAGVEAARADGGTAVIMDPHTGEILAMASWPTFNPNDYSDAPEAARRNRAVQDLYEPGSTFKLVTASAAIQEKA